MEGNYSASDSENEYSPTEKKLLDQVRKRHSDSDSEQEIYGFSESDEDSDKNEDFRIADSDVEGQENSDDDLPDSKAWGKNKRSYYATDYVDKDYGGFGDDEEAALMEEEEAKNIQKRLIEQLGEEDFTLDIFNKQVVVQDKESIIKSDLSQMSKREKLQLFEKESPEFAGLVSDFKTKLTIAKDYLRPILKLINDGKLPKCAASKFVKTIYSLILNYCTNISFYLLLKSQRVNIQNHPVVKRLYQYRQMLNKMEPIYSEVIKPQIDTILQAAQNKVDFKIMNSGNQILSSKRKLDSLTTKSKKLKLIEALENEDEDTGLSDDNESDVLQNNIVKEYKNENIDSEESGFSENGSPNEEKDVEPALQNIIPDEVGDKREITYQIAKNKGLTPYRKKEQRNPRVKHKMKFRKAKIRRKGAIREPRKEITRYSGESSGIKANVKKSIKIK